MNDHGTHYQRGKELSGMILHMLLVDVYANRCVLCIRQYKLYTITSCKPQHGAYVNSTIVRSLCAVYFIT